MSYQWCRIDNVPRQYFVHLHMNDLGIAARRGWSYRYSVRESMIYFSYRNESV